MRGQIAHGFVLRPLLLTPLLVSVLLAGIYLLTPQASLDTDAPGVGYLDAHAHIAGIGAGGSGCFVHPDLLDSYKFAFYLHGFDVSQDELEQHGDEVLIKRLDRSIAESRYVDKAIILALDGVIRDDRIDRSATQVYVPNEFVSTMAKKYPHIEYGASINPNRSDWRERLYRAKRNGALLVKWLPAIMDIDPADKRYDPYYRTLAELDLPLLVHVGKERAFGDVDDALGDPKKLARPLNAGVTVIAAHVATTGEYEDQPSHQRLLAMLDEFPNLYTDISSLTQINKIGYLVDILNTPGAADRLIYGSDWPLQFFPLVSAFYHWPDIDLSVAKSISQIDNKWDHDVALKKALGVPPSVFRRSAELLGR